MQRRKPTRRKNLQQSGGNWHMLGHYDAGFPLRTYTHATRQMQESAAEKKGSFMEQVLWAHAKSPEKREGPSSPVILFFRLGQNLCRYIAAQFLTSLVNAKTPQTLRLAGISGAGNVTRTHDLLITNRIQYPSIRWKGRLQVFSQRLKHQLALLSYDVFTYLLSHVSQRFLFFRT